MLRRTMLAAMLVAAPLGAQTPAADPSSKLAEVLPAEVATRVLAVIADARARHLPADVLEQDALKFAARNVPGDQLERAIAERAARMQSAKEALETSGRHPSGDEIAAGSEALRAGVDGAEISALARSAPSGRSLEVPLLATAGLVDRGLPVADALARVKARLEARASDSELASLPDAATSHRPAEAGSQRPAHAGSRRPAVPANAGRGAAPVTTPTPPTPAPPVGNRP